MTKIFAATRYLILVPIIGLGLAAAFMFLFGGLGLIILIVEFLVSILHLNPEAAEITHEEFIIHTVEYVHTFLVGTVLYLTAMGFFQLFIKEIELPHWMKIDNTEELETSLVGVTVVVLAVNFMSAAFTASSTENLLRYGIGIAFPIAALGAFLGLRAWAAHLDKRRHHHKEGEQEKRSSESEPPH